MEPRATAYVRTKQNHYRTLIILLAALSGITFPGCIHSRVWTWGDDGPEIEENYLREEAELPKLENPMVVTIRDRNLLWNILVDTIEDYFIIRHEEQIQLVGNTLTEGYLQTAHADAATMLEAWRKDNAGGFDQLHATLQTIRRQAEIHVRPSREGFRIEVIVHKLQEDLAQPEYATVGGATLRHSATHSRPRDLGIVTTETLGWIPSGRDTALEQLILNDLQQRMSEATIPVNGPPASQVDPNPLSPIRFPSLGN
ncbi:MAG: hypothetical protein CMJ76_06965 [Planctomycetaceae bacterium]|nr:hypothetical protein [Planctomycetaceae bacterium]